MERIDAGRGFLMAYNVSQNPPSLMWMTPIIPPQDGSDPNWDMQVVDNMVGAWIFNGTGAFARSIYQFERIDKTRGT